MAKTTTLLGTGELFLMTIKYILRHVHGGVFLYHVQQQQKFISLNEKLDISVYETCNNVHNMRLGRMKTKIRITVSTIIDTFVTSQ